jgi:glycosyltransferase involved in cell wall biosynthesis
VSSARAPLRLIKLYAGHRTIHKMADVPSKFRMLYFVRETYPTFRSDVDHLFFGELLDRGHRIDFVMQSTGDEAGANKLSLKSGFVFLARNDLGAGARHKIRRAGLAFIHDVRSLFLIDVSSYDCIQFKDKFLTAAIGVLIAKTKRVKFCYWLSFPFPESRQATTRKRLRELPLYLRGLLEEFLLYRAILPASDRVFVQSAQMKRDLERRGVPGRKMSVVPMGVDLAHFAVAPSRTERASSAATISYLGTLSSERQLVVLIDMLSVLRNDFGMDARVLLVGDGNRPADRAALLKRAAELGVEEFVRITGFLPRAEALAELRTADVCISPFFPTPILLSTSPTKLIEYMALGIPVVANDHPEQSLIVSQSRAGLCVPWGVRGFAEAIARIMRMTVQDRELMGRRGRAWVEENRTYAKIANDVENDYMALLSALP